MAELIHSPKTASQDQNTFVPVASCPEYEVNARGVVRVVITGAVMKHDCVRNIPPRVRLYPQVGGEAVRAVAALVLEAFAGKATMPNVVPLFADGNLSNCTLNNLRWGTHEEAEDIEATYVAPSLTPRRSISDGGQGRRRSNLTENERKEIWTSNESAVELAKRFECSTQTIYRVLRMAIKSARKRRALGQLDEAQALDIMTSPDDINVLAKRYNISIGFAYKVRRGAVQAYAQDRQAAVRDEPRAAVMPVELPVVADRGEWAIAAKNEFVPVVGFPDLEVSRTGIVRHVASKIELPPVGLNVFSPRRVRAGAFSRSVASILLDAFVGPSPYPAGFVFFSDNDVTNIDLANLRWCRPGEALKQAHERKRSLKSKIEAPRVGKLETETPQGTVEPAVVSSEALASIADLDPDVIADKEVNTEQAETVNADLRPGGWRPAVFLPRHLRGKQAIRRRIAYAC